LVVGWSRNEKDVALNQVMKLIPSSAKVGYYLRFNPLDYNRLPAGGEYRDSVWGNGSMRPKNTMNELGLEWKEFRTLRRNEHVGLDVEAVNLATWDVMANHTDALAQLAMTKRAVQAYGVGFDSTQYATNHVASATSVGGGFFSAGTATNPIIKIGLQFCARRILQDTNAVVKPDMLGIVMNPTTAHKLSDTQEIHTYVKESVYAGPMLEGKGTLNALYNLPNYLYGYKVVIDATTYNPQPRLDTSEGQTFVVPDNEILMFCREQKFEGSPNTGSFSTLGTFVYSPNDMKVEVFTSVEDRINNLHVVDETQAQVIAPQSGFLITNVFS
jgi:hypothetical protein